MIVILLLVFGWFAYCWGSSAQVWCRQHLLMNRLVLCLMRPTMLSYR